MRKTPILITSTLLLAAGVAVSQIATDPGNEGLVGGSPGNLPHVDLTALYVSESGSDVVFAVDVDGDPTTATGTDWGNYMFLIETDTGSPKAGASAGNGWVRPIDADGTNLQPDYWLGSWNGGAQLWQYTGSGTDGGTGSNWLMTASTPSESRTTTTITVTVPKTDLGSPNSVNVIAMSSGGGGTDTAIDSVPSHTDPSGWGDAVVLNNPSSTVSVPVELDMFNIE